MFRYFLSRPFLVNLSIVLILVAGLVAAGRMRREALPDVDQRKIYVTTAYPGASPRDVALDVTTPLEREIGGVDGVDRVRSISRSGISRITVSLDPERSDLSDVKQQIRRAVDRTILPAAVVQPPDIRESRVADIPVIEVVLSSTVRNRKLYDRAVRLRDRCRRIAGVSGVRLCGWPQREFRVLVDPRAMNRSSITFSDIVAALRNGNPSGFSGFIRSSRSVAGLRGGGRIRKAEDAARIVLRSNFEGYRIRLSDVARVRDTFADRNTAVRYNGRPAVVLQIFKKKSADIMDVIRRIKQVPVNSSDKNFHVNYFNDLAEETRDKLKLVSGNALLGFILVMVVLFILMDFRTAFWTAAGLPVVLCLAAVFLYLAGVSINSVSLTGVIVVLGMLVDDAIIVAENIFRKRKDGLAASAAALSGVKEVAKPVAATVGTTVIVFLPLLFIPGMIGDFAFEVPLVIGFTLLASLFESFFFLPGHLAHGGEGVVQERKVFVVLKKWYCRIMPRLLRHRYILFAGFVLVVIGTSWLAFRSLKVVLFDSDNSRADKFYVYGRTADGSSVGHTLKTVMKIEAALRQLPGQAVLAFKSQAGIGLWDADADSADFSVSVRMAPAEKRKLTAAQAVAFLRMKLRGISEDVRLGYWVDAGGASGGEATGNSGIRWETDGQAECSPLSNGSVSKTDSD